jgi:hypothetical protein
MAFRHVIKTVLKPSVALEELSSFNDTEEGSQPIRKGVTSTPKWRPNRKDNLGKDVPFMRMRDFIFAKQDILEVIIDETGFVPTISILYEDSTGNFKSSQFPKTNIILELYIKSSHSVLKPIRNDYIITSIRGNETYLIKGELFIPKLYNNVSNSYNNLSSEKTLKKVCKDVQLGFARNSVSPKDKMTWINPNLSSYDFMKHVLGHAWQGDDSFIDGFIDHTYIFNYIDANLQLEQSGEFDNTVYTGTTDLNISADRQDQLSKELSKVPNGLLYYPKDIQRASGRIIEKSLITDQGDLLISDGYKKRIYYYDSRLNKDNPEENMVSFYAAPITSKTEIGPEKNLLPDNEYLKETEIRKWINIQYENTHSQYNASKLINYHNLNGLNKIKLKATVKGINYSVNRGMRIPVGIYELASGKYLDKVGSSVATSSEPGAPDIEKISYEEYTSGIYYVIGNRYIFDRENEYKTEHILTKRDWVPNS